MDFIIEKGVDLPKKKTRGYGRWQKLLLKLELDDSFVIDESNDPRKHQLVAIRNAAKSLGIRVESARETETKRRIKRVE